MAGHEHPDGSVLASAKANYERVLVAHGGNRYCGESGTCPFVDNMNFDFDALANVFGQEKSSCTRGYIPHVSRKQLKMSAIGKYLDEQEGYVSLTEFVSMKNSISNLEGMVKTLIQHHTSHPTTNDQSSPPEMDTPRAEVGSNSVHRPSTLPQNLMNAFGTTTYSNSNVVGQPIVTILSRDGAAVAKGFVELSLSTGICHGKKIFPYEKRVFIEEVIDGNAPIYDAPQDKNRILDDLTGGGYLIWPDAMLRYE